MRHETGLFCGRFQPVHWGHIEVVKQALTQCDFLIIAIGSAQEAGTKRNPFSFELRKTLLLNALGEFRHRVVIIGVNDREELKDDSGWGEYLLRQVKVQTGWEPTITFSGEEAVRAGWFKGINIEVFNISRSFLPFSATQVREALLKNDTYLFRYMTPHAVWEYENMLRSILEGIYNE